ncbi:UDP-glucuronosyltransferase [Aphelenchoides fujianensis]|nr:UDP-glucuronosyltransferase [Aphelenchoides fujianensis]
MGLEVFMYTPFVSVSHVKFLDKISPRAESSGARDGPILAHDVPERMECFPSETRPSDHSRVCDFETTTDLSELGGNAWRDLGDFWKLFELLLKYTSLLQSNCLRMLEDEELIARMKAENFDLGMSEILDPCGFLLFNKIGIKRYIALHGSYLPMWWASRFGLPQTLSFTPEMQSTSIPPFSFVERLKLQGIYWFGSLVMNRLFESSFWLLEKQMGGDFRVEEAITNSSFLFVNTDEYVEFPRPYTSKIISIAGVDMQNTLDNRTGLSEEYRELLDSSPKGAVLVSFGSVAQSSLMENATKSAFLELFAAFPELQFIWKYETPEDGTAAHLPNVHLSKEATYAGVPLVSIPLFGDQVRNAAMIRRKGVGVVVQKTNITAASLIDAVRAVVFDPTYKAKARELASMLREKPFAVDDRIVRYSEFAAAHDVHEHLDLYGRQMNTISSYYNLDVYCLLLAVLLLIVFVLIKLTSFVVRRLLCGGRKSKFE